MNNNKKKAANISLNRGLEWQFKVQGIDANMLHRSKEINYLECQWFQVWTLFKNCCIDFRLEEENIAPWFIHFFPALSNGLIKLLYFSFFFHG